MAEPWQPEEGAELWCSGMRFTGRRTLTVDERAALEKRARRAQVRWLIAVFALPVVLALPLLVAAALGPRIDERAVMALGIAAFVGWIGGVPVLLMTAHDQWRSRAHLMRDCAGGEMQVFEGQPDPDASGPALVRLLRAQGKDGDPASERRLEVLPASRAAVAFAASGSPTLVPVVLVEVAAAPAYALRLPIPVEWRGTEPEPGREFLRRALNPAERSEIETMIRRLRRPNVGTLVVTTFGVLSLASLLTGANGRGRGSAGGLSLFIMIAWGAYFLFAYARGVRIAHRLKRDADVGIVITERREDSQEAAAPPPPPSDRVVPTLIEFLPFSRLIWNQDGRPASWRQLRRAA